MKLLRLGLLIGVLLPSSLSSGQTSRQTKNAPAAKPVGAAKSPGFEALVKKADAARESDQIGEAISLYRQVTHANPRFVEGWWYLGTLFYESDQYAEGQEAFRHVTGLNPEMALGWAMLGLCEFETKDFDRAMVHLERADALKIPSEHDFHDVAKYHLALLLTRAGKFELAIRILADFAQRGKDDLPSREAMGLAALRKPLLPTELPPLEREIVLDVGRAMCDASARRAADADKDVSDLLAKYPNTPQIHFVAGTILLGSDPDRALEEWKAELAISPSHPQALVSIAGEYVKRSEYEKALPYAEKAVTADPGFATTHVILGQALVKGDLDVTRGVRELETAVRLVPGQAQFHFALAAAYARAGRKEDAARERAEFLKLMGQKEVAAKKP